MIPCPQYLVFQEKPGHWNYLSLLTDVVGEPPMLNTPQNWVVPREWLNFSPIYLGHAKVT